jgi:hypothetical protein
LIPREGSLVSETTGATTGVVGVTVGVAEAGRGGIAVVVGEIATAGAGAAVFGFVGLVTIRTIKSFSLIE